MSDPIPNFQKRLSQLSQRYSIDRYSELTTATTSSADRHINASHHQINLNANVNNEWQSIELADNLRELEEAKTRLSQMEKTMKWWSDCTSNWREKWRKVRNERNKAREESKLLLNKLESVNKELFILKKEKSENECEIKKLENELKRMRIECTNKHKLSEDKQQLSFNWCHNCQHNNNNKYYNTL